MTQATRRKLIGRGRSKARGRRVRSATKKCTQCPKRATVTVEVRGRGPKRTTVYQEVYEQEW